MSSNAVKKLRILVGVASFGTTNDKYLSRLINEYHSMPYSIDIVVLSDAPRDLGPRIEVLVGLPSKDPFSLPFAHKRLFSDRINEYDLFIYSEDDMLITQHNVEAFLRATEVLPDDELAGFFRFEEDADGRISYPDVHWSYHWDPSSLRVRGQHTFAFFTNEHAACYMLTRKQLGQAIQAGGFLVAPHHSQYELRETAATDPYTQCGFRKLICISHFSDFLVHHMPNKYLGKFDVDAQCFDQQIHALQNILVGGRTPATLLNNHSEFKASPFGKNYYEPIRSDLVNLIPQTAASVLSIGCGWGATEESLVRSGKRVVAVGLDPVISACAQARGVEVVQGDINSALSRLGAERFDCLFMSNVLHLLPNPGAIMAALAPILSRGAVAIIAVPNLLSARVIWNKFSGAESHQFLGDYAKSGVHSTSRNILSGWLRQGGLRIQRFVDVLPKGAEALCRGTLGLMTPLVSSEIVAVAAIA